jgi:hypothetical protein
MQSRPAPLKNNVKLGATLVCLLRSLSSNFAGMSSVGGEVSPEDLIRAVLPAPPHLAALRRFKLAHSREGSHTAEIVNERLQAVR